MHKQYTKENSVFLDERRSICCNHDVILSIVRNKRTNMSITQRIENNSKDKRTAQIEHLPLCRFLNYWTDCGHEAAEHQNGRNKVNEQRSKAERRGEERRGEERRGEERREKSWIVPPPVERCYTHDLLGCVRGHEINRWRER